MVALALQPPQKDKVTTQAREDMELTGRIANETFQQVRELSVSRDGQQVLLEGSCPSFYVKQLATRAALQLVPGAKIENAIRVTHGR